MKGLKAVRSKNNLFTILSLIISFTFITVWLPLLRCLFDGSSYRWAIGYFGMGLSSRGLTTDYIALLLFFLLFFLLFASFYWIKNRVVFYTLLFLWWLHSFGNLLFDIIKNGDTMFHGDTLNIHISVSKIVVPLSIFTFVLIIFTMVKDQKLKEVHISWYRSNRLKSWIILSPIILLSTGKPDVLTDQIGVLMALVQCFAFPFIFIPSKEIEDSE